jgi:hypothetical protein
MSSMSNMSDVRRDPRVTPALLNAVHDALAGRPPAPLDLIAARCAGCKRRDVERGLHAMMQSGEVARTGGGAEGALLYALARGGGR